MQETWLSEMSAGLFDGEVAHEDEGSSDDNDCLSVNPAVRREGKKTRRQRRIEKERKAQVGSAVITSMCLPPQYGCNIAMATFSHKRCLRHQSHK